MARGDIRIVVHVDIDTEDVEELLDDMKKRTRKMKPVFYWAKRELETRYAANFTANGLPSGGWSPLSPQYASWKATNVPGAPPMVRTGKLFRSVTELENSRVNAVTDTRAEFGTDVEYAKFHQYGTSKMAKRRVIFTPAGFSRDLGKTMARYVAYGVNKGIGPK